MWGLKRWMLGFEEYYMRCCCCGENIDERDPNRMYKNAEYKISSDCCWLAGYGSLKVAQNEAINNPFIGTLCFPVALATHLRCFPFMFCVTENNILSSKKEEWESVCAKEKEYENDALFRSQVNAQISKTNAAFMIAGNNARNQYETIREITRPSIV